MPVVSGRAHVMPSVLADRRTSNRRLRRRGCVVLVVLVVLVVFHRVSVPWSRVVGDE